MLLPTYSCCIIIISCSCHHATLHLSIISNPFLFGSYLICIIICICLLILYLVLDILFKCPSWAGGISFIQLHHLSLSPPYNSTIQLNMSFALYWVLPLAHVGWDGSNSIYTCPHICTILFSHYWFMRATWPPLHALWVEPFPSFHVG